MNTAGPCIYIVGLAEYSRCNGFGVYLVNQGVVIYFERLKTNFIIIKDQYQTQLLRLSQ